MRQKSISGAISILLSLVGESSRYRHEGVKLAFAYKDLPKPVTTIRKISGSKYREHDNQHGQPGTPEHIETLCDIVFLCWIDSSSELRQQDLKLETRISQALSDPRLITRYRVLSLGSSDDLVDTIEIAEQIEGTWLRLLEKDDGNFELPVWVDHAGSKRTRWKRYEIDDAPTALLNPPDNTWRMTIMTGDNRA